jgi:oligopeptide/dipeptide ABC transporter ATP-binding protein
MNNATLAGASTSQPAPVLEVESLTIEFRSKRRTLRAVDDVSFSLPQGESLAIVGESGSGKSSVALALLGLTEVTGGHVCGGSVKLDGHDILAGSEAERDAARGNTISLVFQNPMRSFNPIITVGVHLAEVLRAHTPGMSKKDARDRSVELLRRVGVSSPAERLDSLPGEFSGGMLQRAMIAIAVANQPRVIVADEPTTALDVTVQAQILELFQEMVAETGASLILISHDLRLVESVADRFLVMYAGRIVEAGPTGGMFQNPRHPYTRALLLSRPSISFSERFERFPVIPGVAVSAGEVGGGCSFQPRCALSGGRELCREIEPALMSVGADHLSACHFHEELDSGREVTS